MRIEDVGNVDDCHGWISSKERSLHRSHLFGVDVRAAVPRCLLIFELPGRQHERDAGRQVLPVSFIEGGHFQCVHLSPDFNLDGRTYAETKTLCRAISDRNLGGIGIGPPFALCNFVARRWRVGPTQFGILEHSAGKVFFFHLVKRFAIERNKAALHAGEKVERLRHTRLVLEECPYSIDFVRRDVDEKNVGQFGRRSLADLAQQGALHQVDREDQHDAGTQAKPSLPPIDYRGDKG